MQVEKPCTAVVLRELVLISGQPGTPRWTPVKGRTVFPMPVEMACPRQESPRRQVWKTLGKEAQGCWWIRSSALLIGRTRGARIRDQNCTRCRNHLDRCRSITTRLCPKRSQCAGPQHDAHRLAGHRSRWSPGAVDPAVAGARSRRIGAGGSPLRSLPQRFVDARQRLGDDRLPTGAWP